MGGGGDLGSHNRHYCTAQRLTDARKAKIADRSSAFSLMEQMHLLPCLIAVKTLYMFSYVEMLRF